MKIFFHQKAILLLIISFVALAAYSQGSNANKGNEAAAMYNKPTERDKVAIQEAEAGWWKRSMATQEQRLRKWKEATFGMFLHWGIYSMTGNFWDGKPGGSYAEHIMRVKRISRKDYLEYAKNFNPTKFNAEEWVLKAKNAGMGYIIITAKHHDGFAMYPTNFSSDYSIKSTKFKRDPMAELKAACQKYGILFGFYYSHAFDWEHPDAPGNDWDYNNPGGDKLLGGEKWYNTHPEWLPKVQNYIDKKSIPQIKELLTRYHPDILWFDTPNKIPLSENLKILKVIRETDPDVLVNGRLARTTNKNFGDYLNTADRPEEFYPIADGNNWEAIPTTNNSYGYSATDKSHKPTSSIIRLFAKAAAMNGNILLNFGPKGDGSFDEPDEKILDSLALWMKQNKESLTDVQPAPLPRQQWGVITRRNQTLYLHVFYKPGSDTVIVGSLKGVVSSINYLSTGKKIDQYYFDDNGLHIPLNNMKSGQADEVIVVQMKSAIDNNTNKGLFYLENDLPQNRLLAFYAQQHGTPMQYGDGKTDKYYVTGWRDIDQYLSWSSQLLQSGNFNLQLRYVKDKENMGGTFLVDIGNQHFTAAVDSLPPSLKPRTLNIGIVSLNAGAQEVSIRPKEINGEELMKLLEIDLEPVKY